MFASLKELLIVVSNTLLQFLPDSPFQSFLNAIVKIPALGYLNYFIPVGEMISIGQAWLGCIAIFYIYQGIMRFVKMIE